MPHIPSAPTAELSILPFADAMARSGQSGGYDAEKWLYVPDFYTEYRYLLGTRGEKPLVCIGINPSTAEPDRLDPTLQSVERVAKNNGYDSFLMFNVYAQRATRPNDMERVCNEALHRANMEAFDYILSLSEQPAVWAAWGNIIEQRAYLKDCLADMIAIGERHGKSPAQVILRWLMQRDIVAVPKSTHKERMAQNIDIFDFALTDDDMASIAALDTRTSLFFDHATPAAVERMATLVKERAGRE